MMVQLEVMVQLLRQMGEAIAEACGGHPEQLVIGTDYPFDMGDYDVYALVGAIPGLTRTRANAGRQCDAPVE
ncbi:MAG: hypothetical protein P8Y45_24805 [Exilibacterium sp.]